MIQRMHPKRTERDIRAEALGRLYAARAEYLRNAGWQPVVLGPGQILWLDPKDSNRLREDAAAQLQELRDNDIVHRDTPEERASPFIEAAGYASPTKYAALDPKGIRNEEKG